MTCRSCGADIADKAIVCYRCGTPTAEPVRRDTERTESGPHRTLMFVVVVLSVLAGAAYYYWTRG